MSNKIGDTVKLTPERLKKLQSLKETGLTQSEILSTSLILLDAMNLEPISTKQSFIAVWGKGVTQVGISLSEDAQTAIVSLMKKGWGRMAAYRAGFDLFCASRPSV